MPVTGAARSSTATTPEAPGGKRKPPPPPPKKVDLSKDSEQSRYLQSLERRVGRSRKRSWWLAAGIAAALLVSAAAWLRHYTAAVLSYAELDPAIRIERDPHDPSRLVLCYRPLSGGIVGFRRADEDRETELLDEVPAGSEQRFEWRWSGVREGDQLKVTYRDGWSRTTKALTVPAPPAVPPLGDAVLVGEVVNAINARGLPGVTVRVLGTRLVAQTDQLGQFRIQDAPTGPAAVEVSAPNFSTEQLETDLASNRDSRIRVALNPGMEAGQIRLVLTWNDEPADLDAHLEGPLPEGKQFHICFHEKGDLNSAQFVNLDVDDRDGQGPETITVRGVLPGTYHYFVHDYTNRETTDGPALALSGAEVKLYQGGQTYRFRPEAGSLGNIWHVCDVEVTPKGATVKKINTFESKRLETAASMADVVFLFDAGPRTAEFLDQMKVNCIDVAQRLADGGLNCRFGLVPFSPPDHSSQRALNTIPMTGGVDAFRLKVLADPDPDGEPLPGDEAAALERALAMDFREGVPVHFVLISNTPSRDADRMAAVARQVKERDIKMVVVADPAAKDSYQPLCEAGGRFQSLWGDEPVATGQTRPPAQEAGERPDEADAVLTAWAFDAKTGNVSEGLAIRGIYRLRTQENRQQWVTQYGGTAESEQGVAEGLAWLARHQAEEGFWSNRCLGPPAANAESRCEQDRPCSGGGEAVEMAHTGLALLAFQAGGHYYFNGRKYSDCVDRGLKWLIQHQRPDGALLGSRSTKRSLDPWYMYEHGIATFALAEACAIERAAGRRANRQLRDAVRRAVQFIEKNQHRDGGWRYSPAKGDPSDASVSGWQVLALKSAREAHVDVDRACLSAAEKFFESCVWKSDGQTGYQPGGGPMSEATTGVGMLFRQFLLDQRDAPLVQRASEYLADYAEKVWGRARQGSLGNRDYYLWYNCTLAMFHAGPEPWERWNNVVRDAVLGLEEHEGCQRGSWPPNSRWGEIGGRIYTTALAVLTLEVYYRFAKDEPETTVQP